MSNNVLSDASSTKFHIPALDGIRALAFTLVFFSHAGLRDIVPGGFGVTIFFFLSGYLITTLLRIEYEKTESISLKNFYLRRVLRIFPPMYITLAVGLALVYGGVFENKMESSAVIAQMLHFTNYYMIYFGSASMVPSTGIYWSLAIEEHFYLVFPLALLMLVNGKGYSNIAKLLFLGCVTVLIWRCVLVYGFDVSHNYIYHASDTRLDSLLYGCIMGLWSNPFLERNSFLEQNDNVIRKLVILSISIGLLLLCLLYRNEYFRETFRYSIQGAALFPVFYYAIRHNNWVIFNWLDFSVVRWLGVMSYTLYLSHLIALRVAGTILETQGPGVLKGLLGFVIALVFSASMFLFVEKPIARLRRKLHRE